MPARRGSLRRRLPALAGRHRRGVGDRSGRDDVAGDDRPALAAASAIASTQSRARAAGRRGRSSASPFLDDAAVARAASRAARRAARRRRGSASRTARSARAGRRRGGRAARSRRPCRRQRSASRRSACGRSRSRAPPTRCSRRARPALMPATGARAKPNMISGSSRGCDERRQRDGRLGAVDALDGRVPDRPPDRREHAVAGPDAAVGEADLVAERHARRGPGAGAGSRRRRRTPAPGRTTARRR